MELNECSSSFAVCFCVKIVARFKHCFAISGRVVCRRACFRDKKLSSDLYEKTDEGDDEQADAIAAVADVQSSSDVDDMPARNPVMFQDVQAADVNSVQPGTRHVCQYAVLTCR